jgi:RNA 2',3'-cyclic 3'-phosphodiesterase
MHGAFDFYRSLPARPERLFFGLVPDGETSVRVARFGERFIRDHRLEGTRLKRVCLHVSLHHVGDYRRLRTRFVYAATQAAQGVAMRRFEMTFRFVRSSTERLRRNHRQDEA